MDQDQFDHLSVAIARSGYGRRAFLAVLGGIATAGSLLAAPDEVDGRKNKQQRHRQRNQKQRRRSQRRQPNDHCAVKLSRAGCTFGRVGLIDAWTCPSSANLEYETLTGCDLKGSIMAGVLLNGAKLDFAVLNNANFEHAQMHDVVLGGATMVQARFVHATLAGSHFKPASPNSNETDARNADFGYAILYGADLNGTNLEGAIFQDADLREVSWGLITHCPDGGMFVYPNDCCGHLNGWTTPQCSGRSPS